MAARACDGVYMGSMSGMPVNDRTRVVGGPFHATINTRPQQLWQSMTPQMPLYKPGSKTIY
eukprot:scaffold281855_cov15-Prasinocladus_malaysianus.AAC.1